MSGFLTALGILGSTMLSTGANTERAAPVTPVLLWGGAGLLVVAAVGGIVNWTVG